MTKWFNFHMVLVLQPLSRFVWHWASPRQWTDARFYIAVLFIIIFLEFVQSRIWRSCADRVLTLDMNIWDDLTSTVVKYLELGPGLK